MARRKSVKLKSHGVPVDLPGGGKDWKARNDEKRVEQKEERGEGGGTRSTAAGSGGGGVIVGKLTG